MTQFYNNVYDITIIDDYLYCFPLLGYSSKAITTHKAASISAKTAPKASFTFRGLMIEADSVNSMLQEPFPV
jgi:hypothetical protein